MPIKRIDKFLETKDLGITHSLGIESERLDSCIEEIKKRGIKGVFGCPIFGFNEDNLDFLKKLPFIVQVWFWEIKLKNIEGLYSLEGLKYFGVSEKRPSIDFSHFPELELAVWHPIRNDCGLEDLRRLKKLAVWRFKSADKTYSQIRLPENLEKLDLNWCNPTSLDEFPVLPNLRELQIHYCRNLESINWVKQIAPNLKKLVVTRCANLAHLESVLDKEWEHLHINIKGKTVANKAIKTDA